VASSTTQEFSPQRPGALEISPIRVGASGPSVVSVDHDLARVGRDLGADREPDRERNHGGDLSQLVSHLRVVERELEAGGRN
jgi:hypothetical protein